MECEKNDDPRILSHDMIPVLVKFDKENPVLYDINIDKNEFKIGRGRDNDEILFNLLISRVHCVFECNDDEDWTITNMSSTGTFLNETRLARGKPEEISVGDVLQFSESERFKYLFTMRFRDEIVWKKKIKIDKSLLEDVKQRLNKFSQEQETMKKKLEEGFLVKFQEQHSLKQELDKLLEKQESEPENFTLNTEITRLTDSLCSGNKAELELHENFSRFLFSMKQVRQKFEDEINEKRRIWQSTWSMMEQEQRSIERRMVQQITEWSTKEQAKWSKITETFVSEKNSIREQLVKDNIFFEKTRREAQDKLKAKVEADNEKLALAKQLQDSIQNEARSADEHNDSQDQKNGINHRTGQRNPNPSMHDDDLRDKVENILDEQLSCIVCSELFVLPTTLNCTHTFCEYCIQSWQKKSSECPICRTAIISMNKSRVIDNVIEEMVSGLSSEFRNRRDQLISQRQMS